MQLRVRDTTPALLYAGITTVMMLDVAASILIAKTSAYIGRLNICSI